MIRDHGDGCDELVRQVCQAAAERMSQLGLPGTELRERYHLDPFIKDEFERRHGVRPISRRLTSPSFPRLGAVDVIVDEPPLLMELKWSYQLPGKVFESVWDAIKLALLGPSATARHCSGRFFGVGTDYRPRSPRKLLKSSRIAADAGQVFRPDRPDRPSSRRVSRKLARAALGVTALLLVFAMPAAAGGTPNISLTKSSPSSVLFGTDAPVTLTASNPGGQPAGYNLTFRDVLPANVSYVPGSAQVEPRVIANAPAAGQTTLIWENLSDLSAGSSYALNYNVRHSTVAVAVGATYTNQAGAYLNTNPRFVPKFAANGTPIGPSATSYTGFATAQATTRLTAIEVEHSEPSPEGELLRGAHDYQTVYTLTIRNNRVRSTSGIAVDDYLPAGLEFLGCGTEDNTTDAPTNLSPGSDEEYAGAGALNPGNAPPAPECIAPSEVETVSVDPDGAGPRPFGLYTRVRYSGLGTLAPSAERRLQFVAAVPLRANTNVWLPLPPSVASGDQGSNLDNNSGAETFDEQEITTYAIATGLYDGTTAVSDDHTFTRTAEDLAVQKRVGNAAINQGDIDTWTFDIESSEYRFVDDVRVTDTVPDGLCPLGAVNHEAAPQSAECAPVAGVLPSDPYSLVTENANGTFTVTWDSSTAPQLERMQPSTTVTIDYPTRTRTSYQQNFDDERPVLSRDTWANDIDVAGADFIRCAPADPDCTQAGTKIDADEIDGVDDLDESSASQEAAGIEIDKRIREADPTPVSCTTGAYVDGPRPVYGPGDRVCWLLRANFASNLDSGAPRVTDFLPENTTYEAGSATATSANTVPSTFDSSTPGVLTWDLGSTVDSGSQVFEWRFSTIVGKTSVTAPGDIQGNLMKLTYANTAGQTFPLRDQVDFKRAEAALTLVKGVRDVDGVPAAGNPPNTDGVRVEDGSVVTYRVDVTNAGSRDAEAIEVWDVLPAGINCSGVSAISDGGSCNALAGRIEWTGLAAAPLATKTLTYDVVIPTGVAPSRTFTNRAGVRTYTSDTNTTGSFRYVPENNIDPNAVLALGPTNADPADDTSNVVTGAVGITKTRTTELSETGNNAASEATIGEEIEYTVTTTIPSGTTVYGSPIISDALGTRQTYVPGSATATLNGAAVPGSFTLTDTANEVKLLFPATYTNPAGSGDDVFVVRFTAQVDDESQNDRLTGPTLPNTGRIDYTDQAGTAVNRTSSVSTTIVEPALSLSKNEDDTDDRVAPDQIVRYTVTIANPATTRVSPAHDVVLRDVVPARMTPVNAGVAVPDGGTVNPDGGTWDAATRTITWNLATVAVGGTSPARRYDVRVDAPAVAGTTYVNNALVTGTSLPAALDAGGERTSATAPSGGYSATATDTVSLVEAVTAKDVSQNTATVGDDLTYTLDVTLAPNIRYYDTTVRDALPDGVDYDSTTSVTCVSGCPPNISDTTLAPEANSDGSTTLAWFLGDLDPAASTRVVRIVYQAHVDDRLEPEATPVSTGRTLTNTATTRYNRTDAIVGTPSSIPAAGAFTNGTNSPTETVTVAEPGIALDKTVSGDPDADDRRATQPGDSYTYAIAVTNNGNAPAYDVQVTDTPSPLLENVALTDGAGLATDASAPDLAWSIPGPIAPGATVTLRYTADLVGSAGLSDGDTVPNTADVPSFYGVGAAERQNNGFDYREYTSVPADTVTLDVSLPQLEVQKTTGASGNPESANAEVGRPFTWRVVVRNTAVAATLRDVDVDDVLPPNWSYVPGSATFSRGGALEPTIAAGAGGDALAWTDVTALGPGEDTVLTFEATPLVLAAMNPGTATPHVNDASADGEDASGQTGGGDGPYSDSDSAQATLLLPDLEIEKTPDSGAATAGENATYTVNVTNSGTGTARNLVVTDVLSAGQAYTDGSATALPSGGFSERSVARSGGQTTVLWDIASLAPGASVAITVPVSVPADSPGGSTLENDASVFSDERPVAVTDDGSLLVSRSADVAVTKTAAQSSVNAGEIIDYTLRVNNNGPSDAEGVTVSDTLPADLVFVSAEAPCTEASGTITCSLGALADGASRELDLRVRVRSNAGASVANSASVSTTTADPDPSNDQDTETTPLGSDADLRVEKTGPTAPVLQGGEFTYEIVATNDGPSDATGVTVTDDLPAGVSFVSATSTQGTCSASAGTVTCSPGALPSGQTVTITVTVRAVEVGDHTNTATVDATTPDTNPSNDSDGAGVTVLPAADLAIEKSAPATVVAGGTLAYTLRATNNGPSDATGVVLRDTLPVGTTFRSSNAGCTEAGGVVTCAIGALANGASREVELMVDAPVGLASQTLTNSAEVSGDQGDLRTDNDTDQATTTVGEAADLAIVKTASGAFAGSPLTYTIAVSNRGPSRASGVIVRDPVPAGLALRSLSASQGGCGTDAGEVVCRLGVLPPGGNAQISVVAAVPLALAGRQILNTASVAGDQPDPVLSDNTDSVEVKVGKPVLRGADLEVSKRASSARPRIGAPFTYTIDVTNRGPEKASDVRVTDTISDTVQLRAVNASRGRCAERDGRVTCSLGTLPARGRATVKLTVVAVGPDASRTRPAP